MIAQVHLDWLENRKITNELATKFGLTTTQGGGKNWLTVPYVERGKTVNHKYRTTYAKDHRMDKDAPLTLCNHDCLLDPRVQSGELPVIITEGEWDMLSLIMAGFEHVVSVPNGAAKISADELGNPESSQLRYLWRARDLLDKVGMFVLATDDDEPGRELRDNLSRWLGPERCKFVQYPEHCKDFNDVLRDWEPEALVKIIRDAKPYPIKNIYRLSEFPEPPEREPINLGIAALTEALPLVTSALTVVTGFAGAGKTSMIMAVVAAQLKAGVPVAMGSFETLPKPILQRRLRAHILGCNEYAIPVNRIAEADRIIENKLIVIANNAGEDDEIDLESMIELCRVAVLRDGAKFIVIDPWNEIEHKMRNNEQEHAYTNRAIRALKKFMRDYDVALWIVVHPRKPDLQASRARMPSLYDASGSAHWANKADYGLVMWRPDKKTNVVEAHVTKVRMGYPGKETVVRLAYDFRTSRYDAASDLAECA